MDKQAYLTLRVSVVIPLLQALVSGVLLGIVAGVVLVLLRVDTYALPAGLAAGIVASLAWLSGLRWWRAQAGIPPRVGELPKLTYLEPEPTHLSALPNVRVEILQDGGQAGEFIDLPVSFEKLRSLARGLSDGKSFTESSWCGSGGLFSRGEFVKLRDEMLRRGLLALNSPRDSARGYHLTRGGEACVRYLASVPTTPLLDSHSYSEY